jgi:hypothetical protein
MKLLPGLKLGQHATLWDVWQIFKLVRPMKASTAADYEKRLRKLQVLSNMPVRRITEGHVLMEYNALKGTGGVRSADHCFSVFRALMEFAKEGLTLEEGCWYGKRRRW